VKIYRSTGSRSAGNKSAPILWRSPTAEQVFASWKGIEVASAGISGDAVEPVTPELLEWADLIFVMEPSHRDRLSKTFRHHLKNQKIVVLGIPDEYEYMDSRLVTLLEKLVPPHLGMPRR
jgi:predicted protein tyrosine phosphatase